MCCGGVAGTKAKDTDAMLMSAVINRRDKMRAWGHFSNLEDPGEVDHLTTFLC